LDPGLNASIVETVSAWFTPEGSVTRAVQTGEVALAYNPVEQESAEKEVDDVAIRFDGFASLEKVAPNPHFIEPLPDKGEGVYSVNLSKISAHGKIAVAFKYQIQLDASHPAAGHVPLILSLASKVDPGQTLIKLTYGLNTTFKFSTDESVALSGVVIMLHLDSSSAGKIVQCQATNGGTFARERGLVYWRLNDITLPLLESAEQKPTQDLLVRVTTEGEVKSGNVELRWEIGGERVPGPTGSGIGLSRLVESGPEVDPFADEDAIHAKTIEWKQVHDVRKLRSGTYLLSGSS
jgi:F-BAR domain only protein